MNKPEKSDLSKVAKKLANNPGRSGACHVSCRLSYAAEADCLADASAALTTDSRSGLSVTAAMGCKSRMWRAQRRGFVPGRAHTMRDVARGFRRHGRYAALPH